MTLTEASSNSTTTASQSTPKITLNGQCTGPALHRHHHHRDTHHQVAYECRPDANHSTTTTATSRLHANLTRSYGACGEPAKPVASPLHHSLSLRLPAGDRRLSAASGKSSLSARSGRSARQPTLLQRAAKRVPCLGIILALLASLFLGTAGMLVKVTRSVHGIQVAVLRALIQLVIYGSIVGFRRLSLVPADRREYWPVAGRALLGATSITFSYCALKLIPLGDATTIRFSLPIWTLIVSYLLLGESCNPMKLTAIVIAVSGVVLIAKPEDCVYLVNVVLCWLGRESSEEFHQHEVEHEQAKRLEEAESLLRLEVDLHQVANDSSMSNQMNATSRLMLSHQFEGDHAELQRLANLQQLEGCLMALASSVCLSMSLISMRLCRRTPVEVIILWLSAASVAIGTVTLVVLREWRLPNNWLDVLYILLNGLCGSIGQWFITSALKIEQSGMVALARTFDIQVAFLYSALLLHEHIRTTSIVGSVLVSSGVVIVVVPKWFGCFQHDQDQVDEQDRREELEEEQQLEREEAEEELQRQLQGKELGRLTGEPMPPTEQIIKSTELRKESK